jgi:hypothetical protein
MRAQLVPADGGAPIEIVKDLIVVGRKDDCDLRLEHKSVSKIHCVLVKTDGLLRVRRAALLPNDQLSIAHFKFRVYLGPDPGPAAPPPPQDHTQALDHRELAKLKRKADGTEKGPDSDDIEPGALHRNQLPDVYPDDAGK